ncbi:MAG TPA: hypothetical protein VGF94_01925 [Kofleriaceae bacterium]|jgi:hypothetical protein
MKKTKKPVNAKLSVKTQVIRQLADAHLEQQVRGGVLDEAAVCCWGGGCCPHPKTH